MPESIISILNQLEIKRASAIKPEDWTNEDRIKLLELQSVVGKPVRTITEDHRAALMRQSIAGTENNPPLTSEEQRLIRESNGLE